jgi:2,3-bisphosphoglycerate-dependent phosphoglycerate mutase
MTHLYLIRHADYIYAQAEGRYRDLGLSAEGIKQAERLRERLARTGEIAPDVFISSSERGARETAQILAPVFHRPITLDAAVEEWRSEDGSLSTEEFMQRWSQVPAAQKPFFRWIEGYENWVEFSARAQAALDRILHENAGQTILLLSHGGVIQAAFEYFFGFGLASGLRAGIEVRNTAISHWFKPPDGDKWILERHNDCQHLE